MLKFTFYQHENINNYFVNISEIHNKRLLLAF